MYWIVMLWCVTMVSILMARECSMGIELPFLRIMLMMECASRKNWRVRSCQAVRPFAEEEEEDREEFASAG